ncbi:zinc finger protein 135-like [Leguminivora glycinivorella]|uniref:zinc finger protein 135-like n=1 Tax=Leguminivora glycinivorella TaxID=1035111 RepID=UPI00200EF248|nr:zinc finger protein 135-like [Leguminivora glycinivorella]
MSCFLCFICHNTVHSDTNVETREKYKELVGMKLCSDSHLCHVCCHLLRKLWLFKSICLRRSMEYPVLFCDRGTVNLQNSQIETVILCPEIEECEQHKNTAYHFTSEDYTNQYVSLEDRTDKIEEEEIDKNTESDNDITDFNDFEEIEKQNDDTQIENTNENTEEIKAKEELNKNNDFYKITLSVEEQKAELEGKRREDKYLEAEFKCYNCAMPFLFKDTYQAHMMRHEESNGEHLCPICLLRFASSAVLRAHTQTHRERAVCVRCGATVGARRRNAHRAKCCNTSQAICHLCSKGFMDGNGLQQHIKRFHLSKTSNKTYSCHVCGKTYNNQAAVRTHMIKHINKKFPCPSCGARFSSPYTLAAHSRRHTGLQRYSSKRPKNTHHHILPCQLCSKTFNTQRALASHTQTVHSTEKTYGCNMCGASYTSKKSLGAHIRRHTVQPKWCLCHLCGASFQGNSKLKRHLRSVCEKNKLEEELSAFYNQE